MRGRRPKRQRDVITDANFGFSGIALRNDSVFPGLARPYPSNLRLRSEVKPPAGGNQLEALARYEGTSMEA